MINKKEYLEQYGIKEVSPPATPPLENKPYVQTSVDKMRESLEIKKLQIELEKLEKPDTSIDYYSKMLELQEKSFMSQMEMLRQQGDLRLEIEKLKLMGDGDSDSMLPYLQMLAPILSDIIKNQRSNSFAKSKVETSSPASPGERPKTEKEDNVEVPTTAGELEEYKEAVRRGEISLEEAYSDFLTTPFKDTLTKEQFEIKFNDIKNEKPVLEESKTI